MTRNQKWLKGLVGGDPKPKTVARWWKRGVVGHRAFSSHTPSRRLAAAVSRFGG